VNIHIPYGVIALWLFQDNRCFGSRIKIREFKKNVHLWHIHIFLGYSVDCPVKVDNLFLKIDPVPLQAADLAAAPALGDLGVPALPLGRSAGLKTGDRAVLAGAGGRQRCVAVEVVARQEFAGYWEYVLDEALFTAPAHPHLGGTALIGPHGDLLGIGSLQLQQGGAGAARAINMVVPIDLLTPILEDLATRGRANRPPRPWLGLYATESEEGIVVMGLADNGPAETGGLQAGDVIEAVAGEPVADLAALFRSVWALGEAGVRVPLTIRREGRGVKLALVSGDRERFLRTPSLH